MQGAEKHSKAGKRKDMEGLCKASCGHCFLCEAVTPKQPRTFHLAIARLGLDGFSNASAEADTAKPRSTPKVVPSAAPAMGIGRGRRITLTLYSSAEGSGMTSANAFCGFILTRAIEI